MRVLMYSVVAIVLICVVVPLVQTFSESDLTASSNEKILAIQEAEDRFFEDYGVHSSEYRNLTYLNGSSDLVILKYIDKDYLICNDTDCMYKWTQAGDIVELVPTPVGH